MKKMALNKPIRDERGQALVLTIILLLLGSLIIAPLLGFMSTGLIVGQVFEKKTEGLYAADAGVEDAIWKIMNDPPASYPYSYPDPLTVNGMSVNITIDAVTTFYTLDVGSGQGHNEWFEVESERVQLPYYDADEDAYIHEWQLSLTNKTNSEESVEKVIIGYPNELSYLSGLTDEDIDGLKNQNNSFEDFDDPLDSTYLTNVTVLTWEFNPPPPRPEIKAAPDPDNEVYTTVTCTFELVGPEDAGGVEVIIVIKRQDIAAVWEFKPFKITAVADKAGTTVTTVEAGVLEGSDTVLVGYWEIS